MTVDSKKSLLFAACGFLLISLPQQAAAQIEDYRASCVRFGCTPEQGRRIFRFVDQMQRQIDGLSSRNGISSRTLRAIALELGLRNPGLSADQYVRIIQERAAEAGRLKVQIANLRELVRLLNDQALRTPADAALARAQEAFATGDLIRAEVELASLTALRTSDLTDAQDAWLEAVQAEAKAAHLRGDVTKRRRLLAEARTFTREQRQRAQITEWQLVMQDAGYIHEDGRLTADEALLISALDVYREDALPLVQQDRWPLEWAETNLGLALTLDTLGNRRLSRETLDEAIEHYRIALSVFSIDESPEQWARTQSNLGNALSTLGARYADATLIKESIRSIELALEVRSTSKHRIEWATSLSNLANSIFLLGNINGNRDLTEEAISRYAEALELVDRDLDLVDWISIRGNLANAIRLQATWENDAERLGVAASLQRDILKVVSADEWPILWETTNSNLALSLATRGRLNESNQDLREAAATYRNSLTFLTRFSYETRWIEANSGLAETLFDYGQINLDRAALREAADLFQGSLEALRDSGQQYDLARLHFMAGHALFELSEVISPDLFNRDESNALRQRSIEEFSNAIEKFDRESDWSERADALDTIGIISLTLGQENSDTTKLELAVESLESAILIYQSHNYELEASVATVRKAWALAFQGHLKDDLELFAKGCDTLNSATAVISRAGVPGAVFFEASIRSGINELAEVRFSNEENAVSEFCLLTEAIRAQN